MFATDPVVVFTAWGAAALIAIGLIGAAWKGFRILNRIWEGTQRSEEKAIETLDAIKPDNGGIGGAVSRLVNKVEWQTVQLTALTREQRLTNNKIDDTNAKLDEHLAEAAEITAQFREHIATHQTGEIPVTKENPSHE